MDCTVHGVAMSWTQLSDFHTHTHTHTHTITGLIKHDINSEKQKV